MHVTAAGLLRALQCGASCFVALQVPASLGGYSRLAVGCAGNNNPLRRRPAALLGTSASIVGEKSFPPSSVSSIQMLASPRAAAEETHAPLTPSRLSTSRDSFPPFPPSPLRSAHLGFWECMGTPHENHSFAHAAAGDRSVRRAVV